MANSPSPYRYALTEPAHLGGLALALVLLVVSSFSSTLLLILLVALVAIELFYLLVFARSSAYARRVRIKQTGESARNRELELANRAAALRRDERRRYQGIDKLHRELVELLERRTDDATVPQSIKRQDLDRLKEAALDFSLALQTIRESLKKNPADKLRQELEELEQQSGGSDTAQEARRQTQELLEKRIRHLSSLQDQMSTLESQLQVIDQTFRLMKEQLSTLAAGAPVTLRTDVDALVREVEVTRETVRELGVFQAEGTMRTL